MQTTPELQILILNATILGIAYYGIYPTLREKTANRIVTVDFVLSVLALCVAGAWFWGTGVSFNMLLFHGNWALFTIITMMLMEIPLFIHFARRYGIKLTFDDDEDDRV
ncbi:MULTISPECIES: hypothetical protein [unclassified Yoonia]|uniref:hypothetical protein n=1 Tax=unclassified Yoonia TaxID=2629118 RepID=UPI002AFF5656|nr:MULTISPECIES: hypothetical protein [unclassified Yoonia]